MYIHVHTYRHQISARTKVVDHTKPRVTHTGIKLDYGLTKVVDLTKPRVTQYVLLVALYGRLP
jgi:hypothetical protein